MRCDYTLDGTSGSVDNEHLHTHSHLGAIEWSTHLLAFCGREDETGETGKQAGVNFSVQTNKYNAFLMG